MSPELKQLIDNNEVSEIEIVEFLSTIKKLTQGDILDKKNYGMVLEHFGFKEKKGWIKFGNGIKYKLK